jgi:cation transport ATPase
MSGAPSRDVVSRLKIDRTSLSLFLTALGLASGGILHGIDLGRAGDITWVVIAALGIEISLSSMLRSLRRGRIGVDVIALLALVGAVGTGELFAAAIISVMLATGQALDGWAQGRARR